MDAATSAMRELEGKWGRRGQSGLGLPPLEVPSADSEAERDAIRVRGDVGVKRLPPSGIHAKTFL